MTTISFHQSTRLPRLIVTDLDGTLLAPDHKVTLRSIHALHHAQSFHQKLNDNSDNSISNHNDDNNTQSGGTHIMIASGRSPRSIQKVIDQFLGIMIPDAVLCCNGALTYNPRTKAISFPQFIPLDQAITMVQQLTDEINRASMSKTNTIVENSQQSPSSEKQQQQNAEKNLNAGFACEVLWFSKSAEDDSVGYGTDTFFVCDRVWEAKRKHSIYYDYTVVDDMQAFLRSLSEPQDLQLTDKNDDSAQIQRGGIIKLLALDRNRVASEVYESLPKSMQGGTDQPSPLVNEANGSAASVSPELTLTYSGPYFLEVSGPGVNKGSGLRRYCEGHGIARQDVAAFGDLLNDAEMLAYAGLGLCMGNGHPDMKKLADRVIGTNAEDGLAKEIESWYQS
ncbi:hypothetical protein BGZ94_009840 [Podila epigama]|nr:hypothetical protein BGZ94_009840 [Podila epigama]